MIISPQSLDTNLSQLLAEVKSSSMQLPEFQRDWTWDDNRIRGIIASLSQGYPMGAIMRLQYGNPDIQFKYRTITGVKGVSVKPEHLILDGQQRLTSIYQATSSKEPVSTKTEKGKAIKRYYYLSMEKCLDDDEDRFDAVLSIPEDRKIKREYLRQSMDVRAHFNNDLRALLDKGNTWKGHQETKGRCHPYVKSLVLKASHQDSQWQTKNVGNGHTNESNNG